MFHLRNDQNNNNNNNNLSERPVAAHWLSAAGQCNLLEARTAASLPLCESADFAGQQSGAKQTAAFLSL